ncbi:MAG TPA: hypothetical protein VJU82_14880 [Acidobacteriaceae bacterium]|nr:hypothetical protein [Acidobacteriaceae bacterium]
MGQPTEPILHKLDNIQHRDAILAREVNGSAIEAEWPQADFIVSNPPFSGGKRMRTELRDRYVDDLLPSSVTAGTVITGFSANRPSRCCRLGSPASFPNMWR